MRSVTAITEVFGSGQKLVAVAVEYDRDIDGSTLSTSTFAVTDRTVTKVYANRTAGLARRGEDGRYVIVELSPDDTAAALWVTQQGPGTPPGGGPATDRATGPAIPVAGPGKGARWSATPHREEPSSRRRPH